MDLSRLRRYPYQAVIGTLHATVTESGIVINGGIRPGRDHEFATRLAQLLRQVVNDIEDTPLAGFVAEVFDGGMADASLAQMANVTLSHAELGSPALPPRVLMFAVADRIEQR